MKRWSVFQYRTTIRLRNIADVAFSFSSISTKSSSSTVPQDSNNPVDVRNDSTGGSARVPSSYLGNGDSDPGKNNSTKQYVSLSFTPFHTFPPSQSPLNLNPNHPFQHPSKHTTTHRNTPVTHPNLLQNTKRNIRKLLRRHRKRSLLQQILRNNRRL